MPTTIPSVRIAFCGSENPGPRSGRGWGIWPTGYPAALTAVGAVPVPLTQAPPRGWDEVLGDVHGLVFAGSDRAGMSPLADTAGLLQWCREHRLPLLAIDQGLLTLNTTFGGSCYLDLARELPEALQHRHPPEQGVRHAINVQRNTRLARLYGEGEIVVNSEHRRAIARLARGFTVSARALDGVIEAIEFDQDDWFALGVQWQPASATASGLDIQLFRGLVDVSARRLPRSSPRPTRGAGRGHAARPRSRTRQLVSV
ncbi:MAG TPA: gamma-glutamyl-gamma-aminobutyrate hydrolase family protein [Gemmataceae bacterium]|nr:gamma-glutamyl-gamma-aminobutyrate hydrolase family protein [Gemmataceae bacterium]